MKIKLIKCLSCIAFMYALTVPVAQGAVTYSIGNYSEAVGTAGLSAYQIDVMVSRSADESLIGGRVLFAVENGDGTSGAVIASPPLTFTGNWTSTIWASAPDVGFNSQSYETFDDLRTTDVSNGSVFGGGFTGVELDGVFTRFTVDLSGLAEGTYTLTPNFGGASTVLLEASPGVSVPVGSTNGSLVITAAAVPEPASLGICAVVCAGVVARQRRRAKKSRLQVV
ncbi:hypothetical protein [Rhodopirellula sp. P2]|uniref:hypothetical protein n=1 Tax=Rhodopirellula sp. P2 TaxID=2127060 RepID=UPI0023683027|nr:hypothetical protein [Rhodopirellula sp. P2]WDQ16954.1 hypothetical protein PSR62_00010 [Rhodopirellula sp. P2]